MKYLFIFSGLVMLLTACEPKAAPFSPPPPEVTVVKAKFGDVYPAMRYVARVEAYSSVDLRARVEGYLEKRCFTEGQFVKEGDLLFQIEDVNYKAELEVAEGNLIRVKAAYENTARDFARQEQLLKQNATAKQSYDAARFALKEAEGVWRAQEGTVDLARQKLSYTRIRAPFDGQIGFAAYSEGNLVGPSSLNLANMTRIDKVRIKFNLSEVDLLEALLDREFSCTDTQLQLARVKEHLRVKLAFQDGVPYAHEGELAFLSNRINAGTGAIQLEAVFQNPEHLLVPGLYVNIILESAKPARMLLIPQRAVTQTQAGDQVITVDSRNVTDLKIIQTGLKYGAFAEVKSGLSEGEYVITEGALKASRRDLTVRTVFDISAPDTKRI